MKKIFYILLITTLISCVKTADDARKVKVGLTETKLISVMGEPKYIRIENGSEVWVFPYGDGGVHNNWLYVTMVNKKVNDFYSY